MQDEGYEHAHSSLIKTPRQLVVVIVLAFAVPVIGIILLTQFVTRSHRPDPAALASEAVAARIQPVARVEVGDASAESSVAKAAAPAPAGAAAAPAPAPPAVAAAPAAAAAGGDSEALLQKYGCLACHATDKKIVGPPYREVAAKYAGDKDAPSKLAQKVKAGGAGNWGQVPMPPNPQVPDNDLQAMIKFVLAQK